MHPLDRGAQNARLQRPEALEAAIGQRQRDLDSRADAARLIGCQGEASQKGCELDPI